MHYKREAVRSDSLFCFCIKRDWSVRIPDALTGLAYLFPPIVGVMSRYALGMTIAQQRSIAKAKSNYIQGDEL